MDQNTNQQSAIQTVFSVFNGKLGRFVMMQRFFAPLEGMAGIGQSLFYCCWCFSFKETLVLRYGLLGIVPVLGANCF